MEQAGRRIVILGCGALAPTTIAAVRRATGLRELHFAALHDVPSGMDYRNPMSAWAAPISIGSTELTLTDPELVRATIAAARA